MYCWISCIQNRNLPKAKLTVTQTRGQTWQKIKLLKAMETSIHFLQLRLQKQHNKHVVCKHACAHTHAHTRSVLLTMATNLWFLTTSRMRINSDSKLLAQTSRILQASVDCWSSVATGILPTLASVSNRTHYTCTQTTTLTTPFITV